MALIFSASGDTKSGPRSSRIIGPIVRWLIPNISDQALDTIVFTARKAAHTTEYAVLALLLFRAFHHSPIRAQPHPTFRRTALLAFTLCVFYAITDELHQAFVPNRTGQPLDVLIDSIGAAFGLFLLWLFGRWRKYW